MNLIIQTVFNVPDESNPQEMLHRIGDYLNSVINESEGLGDEVKLYGMELKSAVDDNAGKRVFMHYSDDLSSELGEILQQSNREQEVHIIRVSIDGEEDHRRRFELMDEIIESIGRSLDEEQLNVYFVFDPGDKEVFSKWAIPLIVNPNPILIQKAKSEKVTFCQWITREERDLILKEFGKNSDNKGPIKAIEESVPKKKELDEAEKWFKEQFE